MNHCELRFGCKDGGRFIDGLTETCYFEMFRARVNYYSGVFGFVYSVQAGRKSLPRFNHGQKEGALIPNQTLKI